MKSKRELIETLDYLKDKYDIDIIEEVVSILRKMVKGKTNDESIGITHCIKEIASYMVVQINELCGRGYKGLTGRTQPKWKKKIHRELGSNVIDHIERTQGKIVAHPYHLTGNQMDKLVTYCKENNLECMIDSESEYYPLFTLKLTIGKHVIPIHRRNVFEGTKLKED